MEVPGGLPTSGLEAAVKLLAEGADLSRVCREVLRAAAQATGAHQALAVAHHGNGVTDVGTFGATAPCLRAAAGTCLAEGTPARRSDPVEGYNAGAIPVVANGRVVAALAVAGPVESLDPRPLDTAGAFLAVALTRAGTAGATTNVDVVAPLLKAPDRPGVAESALEALAALLPHPAFICLGESGRLQVARYRGLEREQLSELVTSTEFLDLLSEWRDQPMASRDPAAIEIGFTTSVLACAPILGPAALDGALVVVAPAGDVDAALHAVAGVTPHVGAALGRVSDQAELRRRDHEVDAVVQSAPLPMLLVDAEGCFQRVNPSAAEVFGLSGSFDAGRPVRGRLGNLDLETLLLDRSTPGEAEVTLGNPPCTFRAVVTRVYDGPVLLRSVLSLEDLSSRREQQQARDDFVAVIGHELRTPLTVAKGFIETTLKRGDSLSSEDREEFLGTALRQTERLEGLVNDLLFLSTERPREGLAPQECDVLDVVGSVVGRYAAQHPDRDLDCIGLAETAAVTDRRLLEHAVRHLVDNAIKYSEGPVRVEIAGDAGSLDVAVVDQGPGIFSGDLERLFEPFEQKDSSSTRSHGGTGLGLYVARRLVEALGGRLDCDSRLGQGSRFSFRIPRRVGVATPRKAEADAVRDDARS